LIGRADLAKYLPDAEKANEISRGHLTVFQEDDRFFIEDGKTMVQRAPSKNKTWLVRGTSRILVTGTGRNELQDNDEIDVAELVTLQFLVK
jgi:pSer/pThr/pTyr-binding forkhead associated (FHA) protein